jgi:hypothetical protein
MNLITIFLISSTNPKNLITCLIMPTTYYNLKITKKNSLTKMHKINSKVNTKLLLKKSPKSKNNNIERRKKKEKRKKLILFFF